MKWLSCLRRRRSLRFPKQNKKRSSLSLYPPFYLFTSDTSPSISQYICQIFSPFLSLSLSCTPFITQSICLSNCSLSLSLLPRSSIFLAIYLTLCLSLPRFFCFYPPSLDLDLSPLYTYLFHFLCLSSSYLSPHHLLFLGLKMV